MDDNDIQTLFSKITKEIEKNLPSKLKELRIKAGLTTIEAGRALNKTAAAVTMWETGKSLPDILTLFKLRKLYGLGDLNEFFDETPPLELKLLSRSEQEVIELWKKAPSDVRTSIKNILKHVCRENYN